jgi:hypothetical protein
MGDDNGIVIQIALVLNVANGIHNRLVTGRTALDHRHTVRCGGNVLGNQILGVLHPLGGAQHQNLLQLGHGDKLLDGINDNGLVLYR